MFETFSEKYNELEKKYDKKDYDGVVRDGGKTVESLVGYIFKKFPATLKTYEQKKLFVEFEKKFQTENGNRFLDFISKPTTGVSIGYYIKLCKHFAKENHVWLKTNIKSALDTAKNIRNKFAHSRPGDVKPGDDDASDMLDAFEIIIEELGLKNETPDSLGIPLASYLIYSSIKYNFDEVAQKEEDYKKIISDSRKTIPQLLEHLFYTKYYEISIAEKAKIFEDKELWSDDNDGNKSSAYERIFAEIQLEKIFESVEKVDDAMQKYLDANKEKYDRRGVKPYTKMLDILVEELTNFEYKNYLKYAVTVKNKYLHNNDIDQTERIELKSSAKSLNITSKTAYRIEQEVIRVIDDELTLYQTLQSVVNENDEAAAISPTKSMLIEMIKQGTPEEIVIKVAESQNFKGDIYQLLSENGISKTAAKTDTEISPKKEAGSEQKNELNVLFGEAVTHYGNKEYDKGITGFTRVIAIDPKHAFAYSYRGSCYYGLKNYEQAAQDYSEAIKLDSKDGNAYYNRANCYFALKNYEKAIQDYTEKINLSPKHEAAYTYRGHSNFYLKEYEKAILDYNESITLNSRDKSVYNNRGNCFYNLKQYDKAIQDYSECLKLKPDDKAIYISRGHCYYNLKQYSEAIGDYSEAIRLDPQLDVAFKFRGYSYYNLQNYAEAIQDFDAFLAFDPNDENIMQFKKLAVQKQGDSNENLKTFKDYNQRGIKFFKSKEYDKAIQDFTEAIKLAPKNAVLYQNRGDSYYNLKQYEKAIQDFNTSLNLNADSYNPYNLRGNSYYGLREYNKAIQDYTEAIRLNPEDAVLYSNRGNCYFNLKNYQKAIEDYDKALKLNPENKNFAQYKQNAVQEFEKQQENQDKSKSKTSNEDINELITKAFGKGFFGKNDKSEKENLKKAFTNTEEAKAKAETFFKNGKKLFQSKDYENSIANFTKAIELNQANYAYFHCRGQCYFALKKYDLAIHDFTKAVELYSKDANTFYNRGLCYVNLKKYDKALQDYNKSIELNPKQDFVYNSRGNCYYNLKEYEKAISDYDEAIKLNEKDFNYFYNRGNSYYAIKKYHDAIVSYCMSTILNPEFVPALNGTGNCHYNLKDYSKAIEFYDAALAFDPKADYIIRNKKNAVAQLDKK